MVVGIKDSLKLVGVSVICFCAVLVCAMFLNYNADLVGIEALIDNAASQAMYDAQVLTSKVVVAVTGLCLLATSAVTLLFYVKHFIDVHKKELGILKAYGYSELRIAMKFWIFGTSVLIGTAAGFGIAQAIIPSFYRLQNADGLLPTFGAQFHGELLALLVILPTVIFGALAVIYAYFKLKMPVLGLIKDNAELLRSERRVRKPVQSNTKDIAHQSGERSAKRLKKSEKESSTPYLRALPLSVLKSKKSLPFFIWFAAFCFSAMTQMSASMKELSSEMMGAMMLTIGLTLAFTTLLIAITTAVKDNARTVALMRAMGYTREQCARCVQGVYRPFAYAGFAIGTGYQFGLLKLMVAIVFKDVAGLPDYSFDWKTMLITLAAFVAVYETIMLILTERIKKIPIKQIMSE